MKEDTFKYLTGFIFGVFLGAIIFIPTMVWASDVKVIDRFCLPVERADGQFTITKFVHDGHTFYVAEKSTGYGTAVSIIEVK